MGAGPGRCGDAVERGAPRSAIYERDSWTCQMPVCLCPDGRALTPGLPPGDPWAPTIDHVTPRFQGGDGTVANKRAAHRECNNRAGAVARRAAERVERRRAVLAVISTAPGCTVGDIIRETGLDPDRIWATLNRAERAQEVTRSRVNRDEPWRWILKRKGSY